MLRRAASGCAALRCVAPRRAVPCCVALCYCARFALRVGVLRIGALVRWRVGARAFACVSACELALARRARVRASARPRV
eukprot:2405869-Alexandrium_andersonii.AAC.1